MHEVSVMSQVARSVLQRANEIGALRILAVRLQVGELTFLGPAQMQFAFEIIRRGDPLLENARLVLEEVKAAGRCAACGFEGVLSPAELPEYHFNIPSLDCPDCGKKLEIVRGRDLVIKDIEVD